MKIVIQYDNYQESVRETLEHFTQRKQIPNTEAAAIAYLEEALIRHTDEWNFLVVEDDPVIIARALNILKDKNIVAPIIAKKLQSAFSNINILHATGTNISDQDLQAIVSEIDSLGTIDITAMQSLINAHISTHQAQLHDYILFAKLCEWTLKHIDAETTAQDASYETLHPHGQPEWNREAFLQMITAQWAIIKSKESQYLKDIGFTTTSFRLMNHYLPDGQKGLSDAPSQEVAPEDSKVSE